MTFAAAATGTPADLLAQADRAANAKDWDRAADLLVNAGEQTRVLDKRTFYLSRAKRYDEALSVLSLLRAREPHSFMWQYMSGYQYYEQKRWDEAVPWLIAAYRIEPTHLRNLYRLAHARRGQGETDRAIRAAAEVLRLWHELPESAQQREAGTFAKASYLLGRHHVDRGEFREAVPFLQQAADHDQADHDKWYLLGKALRRTDQLDAALTALQRAQRIKPRDYIERELAAALTDAGNHEQAAHHLRRGTRNVRGWPAWKSARIALALGQVEEARRLLTQAGRDRQVKTDAKYEQLRAELDAITPAATPPAQTATADAGGEREAPDRHRPADSTETTHRGTIDHLRADRGFGFLTDETNGARCHFKLRGGSFQEGQAVTFVRADTGKGPAARNVSPSG